LGRLGASAAAPERCAELGRPIGSPTLSLDADTSGPNATSPSGGENDRKCGREQHRRPSRNANGASVSPRSLRPHGPAAAPFGSMSTRRDRAFPAVRSPPTRAARARRLGRCARQLAPSSPEPFAQPFARKCNLMLFDGVARRCRRGRRASRFVRVARAGSAQAQRHRTRASTSPLCTIQCVAASLTSAAPGVMVTTWRAWSCGSTLYGVARVASEG
jgi:hypothetical protein